MLFVSTRGQTGKVSAAHAIKEGLAGLSYFLTDYTADELTECAAAAYAAGKFGADPAPLRKVGERTDVLELWHGPTMAFKDIALQILPHLMTKAQEKTGSDTRIVILAATSGDTGKAALEGFEDVPGTEIIVFPSTGEDWLRRLPIILKRMRTRLPVNALNRVNELFLLFPPGTSAIYWQAITRRKWDCR